MTDQLAHPSARDVSEQIQQLKRESVAARLALIARTFPEVMQDAEWFVTETKACPWEYAVAFVNGPVRALREKYDVLLHHLICHHRHLGLPDATARVGVDQAGGRVHAG